MESHPCAKDAQGWGSLGWYGGPVPNVRDPGVHGEVTLPAPKPVKRGLVAKSDDWKWGSYRHYALRETGVVEIESQWTATDREQKARGGPGRIFLRPGQRPKNGREPGAPSWRDLWDVRIS
jgi:hypothetical protein